VEECWLSSAFAAPREAHRRRCHFQAHARTLSGESVCANTAARAPSSSIRADPEPGGPARAAACCPARGNELRRREWRRDARTGREDGLLCVRLLPGCCPRCRLACPRRFPRNPVVQPAQPRSGSQQTSHHTARACNSAPQQASRSQRTMAAAPPPPRDEVGSDSEELDDEPQDQEAPPRDEEFEDWDDDAGLEEEETQVSSSWRLRPAVPALDPQAHHTASLQTSNGCSFVTRAQSLFGPERLPNAEAAMAHDEAQHGFSLRKFAIQVCRWRRSATGSKVHFMNVCSRCPCVAAVSRPHRGCAVAPRASTRGGGAADRAAPLRRRAWTSTASSG
jgi:hypothetical protein